MRSEERRVGKEGRSRWTRGQAEDGIRDLYVTGVQTCALPISRHARALAREVTEDVDRAADFALGLGQRLAFLARHVRRHGIEGLVQNVRGLVEQVAARRTAH